MIGSSKIGSQSELVTQLKEQGYSVTQASVSRDLDELGIVKLNGCYSQPRKAENDSGFGPVMFDTSGDNLIIGRCASGLASAVTVKIDAAKIHEIVGTVAGDDTIFIAVKNRDDQNNVLKIIAEILS